MSNFFDIYKGKKILVTGATGFKGSWLSTWLLKLGANVIGYSLEPISEPSMFKICNLGNKINNIIGDIRDYNKLVYEIRRIQPDIIFHLAAQPLVRLSYKNPLDTYEINVCGTVNVLEAARNVESVKAVLVITSDKCYENKEWVYAYREDDMLGGYDPYSSSKACAELVVSSYRNSFYSCNGIALATVRAGNVIGGGDWAEDRLIPDFVRAVLENKSILVRNPNAIRPWQHVLEPLSGYLLLGALMLKDNEKYNSAWNFGPYDKDVLTVEDVLKLCIKYWGKGSIEIDKSNNFHEANFLKLDITKAHHLLRWKPIYNINESIYKTILWYKAFYENKNEDMFEFTLIQIDEYEKRAKDLKLVWSEKNEG